jgi:CMP-2-keto-3-deoxyoctulosonic acid synthetase
MISPAAAELIRRAKTQLQESIAHVQSEEPLIAEVWLRASVASMDALEAHLNAPEHRPMRKMVLVVMPREEEAELPVPEWAERKR